MLRFLIRHCLFTNNTCFFENVTVPVFVKRLFCETQTILKMSQLPKININFIQIGFTPKSNLKKSTITFLRIR